MRDKDISIQEAITIRDTECLSSAVSEVRREPSSASRKK